MSNYTAADFLTPQTFASASSADIASLNAALSQLQSTSTGSSLLQNLKQNDTTINFITSNFNTQVVDEFIPTGAQQASIVAGSGGDTPPTSWGQNSSNTINWDPNRGLAIGDANGNVLGYDSSSAALLHEIAHATDPNYVANMLDTIAHSPMGFPNEAEVYAVQQEGLFEQETGQTTRTFYNNGVLVPVTNSTEHTVANSDGTYSWQEQQQNGQVIVTGSAMSSLPLPTLTIVPTLATANGDNSITLTNGVSATVSQGNTASFVLIEGDSANISGNASIYCDGVASTVSGSANYQCGPAGNLVITQNANTNLTVNNSNGQNVTVINGNSSGDTFSYTGQGGIIDLSNSAIALAAGSSATLSGNGNTLAGGANASIELAGASINDIITMATTGTVVVDTGAACTVVNALTITAANSTNVTVEGTSATTVTAGTASTVNVGSNTNNDVVSVGANGTVSVADGDHGEVVNETGGTVTLGNGAAATVVGNDSINGGTGSTLTLSGIDTVNSTNDKLYLGGSTNITTSGTGATIYTGLNDVITGNGDIFNIGGNLLAGQVATTGYTTINGTANIVNAGIGTMFGLSGIDTVNGTSDKLFLTGSANLTTNGTGMMVYTGLNDVITGNGDIFNIGGNLLAGQVATTGYTTINGNANTVNAGTGTMFGLSGSDTLNGTNDKLFLTDSASLTAIGAGMTVYTDLNNVINGTGLTVDTGGNLQAGEAATSGYTTIVGNANTINAGTGTMFGLSGSDTLNGTNDKLFLTDSASLTAIGAGMTVYTDLNNVINGTGLTVDTGGNLQAGEAATSGYTTIVGNANTINAGTGTMFGLSGSDTVNGTSDKLFLTDSANLTAIGAGMTVYTDLNNVINGTGLTVNTGGNLQAGEVATSGYTTIVGNANTINAGTGTMFGLSGTITSADSLRDFVLYAVGHGRFAAGAIRASPWLLGLLAGVCGRGEAKARFLAATVGGMEQARLEELARDFAVRRLPAMVRPEMLARIAEHKRLSHRLVLVSASPSLYLKHWAENAGFDTVLATELAFRDERFSGTLASSNCWGPQKVQRLQHWFDHRPPQALYAYGDSRGDREMLALADHAWLRGAAEMPRLDDWPAKTIAGRSAGVS